jgi:hypothetical protein
MAYIEYYKFKKLYMFTKLFKINIFSLTIILVLAFSLLNFNVQASESLDLTVNKRSFNQTKLLLENIKDKDKLKSVSQKLTKNNNDNNRLNSDQKNIKLDFNLKDKKVKLSKLNDDISISIPEDKEINSVDIINDKVIYSGEQSKSDIIVEAVDGGVRQVINIKSKDAPNFYDFKVELKPDYKLSINNDGSAVITKPNPNFNKKEKINLPKSIDKSTSDLIMSGQTPVISIGKPWAVDANKKDLKTWYTVENGNTLRQHINLENAAFPVVADPLWCGNAISTVNWINRDGMWSASNNPTWCGAWNCAGQWACWQESFDKTSSCALWSGWTCVNRPWNKQWNTNQYWSMYNQFMCHADFPQGFKTPWNIEPAKKDKGYWGFVGSGCN